jgi:protein TonB
MSLTLHAAALSAALLVARHGDRLLSAPDKEAQVELLMVEQKGAGVSTTASPASPPAQSQADTEPTPPRAAPPSPPDKAEIAAAPPPPPQDAQATEALPAPPVPPDQPPAETQPAAASVPPEQSPPPAPVVDAAPPSPPTPAAATGITFNLGGTDSESNALAEGDGIIPASPDDRHRNRPPVYPDDAAQRGEHGTVILLIHVSPLGLPAGADVVESSGHSSLDQAALQAVQDWRFVPAVKDGRAMSFDMPMRFVFTFN